MDNWNEVVENVEVFEIFNDGIAVAEFEGEITAQDVKQVLADQGISRGQVNDTQGRDLLPSAFPVTENLVITQINKAG